jgi:REP element-mobilizing transposase RayT
MAPAANDRPIHHRRTIRLPGWDYAADGAYFVTVCSNFRTELFGEIVGGRMRLNAAGDVAARIWRWLPEQHSYVVLDEWCLMPNHLHGILTLTGRGGSRTAPTCDVAAPVRRKTVGRLIGAFKTVSTKHINQLHNTLGAVIWQRNFWEHIVRDVAELDRIRDYIRQNPTNWPADPLNPDRVLPATSP